jgi:hypothetical protein
VNRAVISDIKILESGLAISHLLSRKNEALLIHWNRLAFMNLALEGFNGIIFADVKSYALASQSLDKNLHTTAQSQNPALLKNKHNFGSEKRKISHALIIKYLQVQGGLLLDVVVCQRVRIFQLFAGENEALLVRRYT